MKLLGSISRVIRWWLDPAYVELAGARVYFNDARSGLAVPVFLDAEKRIAATRPVILDSNGECSCFIDPELLYTLTVEDHSGMPLMQIDKIEGRRLTGPVIRQNLFGIGNFKAYR